MKKRLALFMAISMLFTCLFAAGPVSPVNAASPESFYVSPDGDDSGPGTSEQPFRTLERARQAVRGINSSMTGDIYVYLKNGTYALDTTLTFDSSDSGKNGYNVIYTADTGAAPVISGGVDISTGWEVYDSEKNIYKREGVDWDFRQLYVNDNRGIRAREPNMVDEVTGGPYFRAANGEYPYKIKPTDISAAAMSAITSNSTAEMILVQSWSQVRGRIGSFNAETGAVDFKFPESGFSYNHHSVGDIPYFIENDLSLLNAEGEWFLDTQTDTLYYKPKNGETMNTTQIIAPKLDTLVNFEGSTNSDKVHNIEFSGITFKHSNWLAPSSYGYVDVQAGFRYQTVTGGDNSEIRNTARYTAPIAMLQLKNTSNIRLIHNTFQYSGSWGIMGYEATDNTTIDWNNFVRNAGGGVAMGIVGDLWDDNEGRNPEYTLPDGQSIHDTITNNTIDAVSLDYKDMVAIGAMLPQYMTVANNEIKDMPYTGITIGWNWSDADHGMTDNRVYQNYVHDSVRLLQDGGGIYILGRMDGKSDFYYNYMKNLRQGPWACFNHIMGIYMDGQTCYAMAERNVVENAEHGFFTNGNHDNIVRYNYYNVDFGGVNPANSSIGNIYTYDPNTQKTVWPQEALDIMAAVGPGKAPLPAPAEPINMALNKSVTASSIGVREVHPAEYAVDGDTNTRWACVEGYTDWSWIEVDLGGEYPVGSISTLFELNSGYNYKIEYALSDRNWKEYVDKTASKTNQRSYTDVKEVTARYIKITMKSDMGSSINEINIYPGQGGTTPEANSLLLKKQDTFDKNPTRQQDIQVKIAFNGGSLSAIRNGDETLVQGQDYILHWDQVILKKSYLNALSAGEHNLTFDFAAGDDQPLKIEVVDDDGMANLSLNKPVASSSQSKSPQLAVDGDTTTRWAQQEGQWNLEGWLCVDLQGIYSVSSINTMFELASGYNYKIEYSLNGQDWETYADKYSEKTKQQIVTDKKSVTARYVRIKAFYEMGPSIFEFSVFGVPAGPDSSIGTTQASFDKEPDNQSDIQVNMDLKGNTLAGIKNRTLYLKPEDYTVDGNTVTIKKSYLAKLGQGKTNLTFEFSSGQNSSLEIDVTEVSGEINIALSKFVDATSQSLDPQYLTDGDETTRWSEQAGMGQAQSLKVDLGQEYTITRTSTVFELNSGYKYKIEYSTDGSRWSSYADKTGSYTTKQTNDDQNTVIARYMRLSINDPKSSVGINEFKVFTVLGSGSSDSSISPESVNFEKNSPDQAAVTVDLTLNGNTFTSIKNGDKQLKAGEDYILEGSKVTIGKAYLNTLPNGQNSLNFEFSAGEAAVLTVNVQNSNKTVNAALNKPVSASSQSMAPELAVDGKTDTRWAQLGGVSAEGWLAVDLQGVYSVESVTTLFELGNGYKYKIEYSMDGENWQAYVDKTASETERSAYSDIKKVTARFMRIKASHGWGPSIYEFSVYGNPTTPDSTINIAAASFNKDPLKQSDIQVVMDLKGNTLTGIKNRSIYLKQDTDYSVSGSDITINKSYLATLGEGKAILTFEFSSGINRSLEVNVSEINGEINIALGKAVTASSQSKNPLFVTDGDTATRWAQQEGLRQGQWLVVDLGGSYDITGTSTMFELESGYKYKIEYSENGTDWQLYADKTAEFTTQQTNDDEKEATARYVKLSIPESEWGASVYEFKVFTEKTVQEPDYDFIIAPVGSGLVRAGGIQAAVTVSPAETAYQGPVVVLFQLMDGNTPKGIIAVKQNIDASKEVTAYFNVDPAKSSYKVKVFVLDRWDSDTGIPESLGEAITLN